MTGTYFEDAFLQIKSAKSFRLSITFDPTFGPFLSMVRNFERSGFVVTQYLFSDVHVCWQERI